MQNNQCDNCKWYAGNRACKAFPDGIPNEIWEDGNSHDEPLPSQEDNTVFTEKADTDDVLDLLKK